MGSEDKQIHTIPNEAEIRVESRLSKCSLLFNKKAFVLDTDFYRRVKAYLAARFWKKPPARFQKYEKKKIERMPPLSERIWFLSENVNLFIRTLETAEMLKTLTNSEGYHLFIITENLEDIFILPWKWEYFYDLRYKWSISKDEIIACYVMRTKEAVATDTSLTDTRFLAGHGIPALDATYILALPIVDFGGNCVGVLQLYRENEIPYEMDFMEYASTILQVVGETINQNKKRVTFLSMLGNIPNLSKKLNNAMTSTSHDGSISYYCTILKYVKNITDAEKVSIFLVKDDSLTEEISTDDLEGLNKPLLGLELQLANLTFKSGMMLKISDLFTDTRFDTTEQLEKGYILRSVLNVSLGGKNSSIGVLQAINKLSGGAEFSACGEMSLNIFADYCTLWYYYLKIVDYSNRLRNGWKMYSNDVYSIISKGVPQPEPLDINDLNVLPLLKTFYFNLTAHHMTNLPKLIFIMIENIAGEDVFSPEDLHNFIKMTRKFYGEYYHGLKNSTQSVQFLFAILNVYPLLFSHEEKISLIMAAFCSTIHRQYPSLEKLKKANDPLLIIFDDNFVQRYAFKCAKFLIKCSNLFHKINEKTQEYLINSIEENILSSNYNIATEIAIKIRDLMIQKKFDCADLEHQKLLKALIVFVSINHCHYALSPASFREYIWDLHTEIICVTRGDEVDQPGDPILQLKTLYAIMAKHIEMTVLPFCRLLTTILPNLSDVHTKMINNCKILTNIVYSDLDFITAEKEFFIEEGDNNMDFNTIINY